MTHRKVLPLCALIVLSACAHRSDEPPPASPPSTAPAPLSMDEAGVAERPLAAGKKAVIGFVRRGVGPGHPALFVLGGPMCIEWFGRYLEPALDVVYFEPAATSLRLSERIADVEALRETLGLERVHLFGHSDNGAVSLEYAAAHGERVESIIWVAGLNDHPASIRKELEFLAEKAPEKETRAIYRELAAKERFNVLDLTLSLQSRKLSRVCTRAEICRRAVTRAGIVLGKLGYMEKLGPVLAAPPPSPRARLLFAAAPDLRGKTFLEYRSHEAAKRLGDLPILMIQGGRDGTVPRETSAELAGLLPRSELVVFEASGHLPFLEEQERFVTEVRRFLGVNESLPPSASPLGEDWKPPYDTGELSAAELETEAADALAAGTARMADGMLEATCMTLGTDPLPELLAELGLTAKENEAFRAAFCPPVDAKK